MLKAVYPAIKAANPQCNYLNGGCSVGTAASRWRSLLRACWSRAPATRSISSASTPTVCSIPKNPDGHDVYFRSCANDWKLDFLRSLTRRYGIPNKPMMRTEAGLLCSVAGPACREAQANYAARHYARTARDGILSGDLVCFDSDSFQNSALVEPTIRALARPAFQAMRHAAAMYGGADYLGPLAGQPAGVEGYQFERGGEYVTIVWSRSNTPQTASVPVRTARSAAQSQRATVGLRECGRCGKPAGRCKPGVRCRSIGIAQFGVFRSASSAAVALTAHPQVLSRRVACADHGVRPSTIVLLAAARITHGRLRPSGRDTAPAAGAEPPAPRPELQHTSFVPITANGTVPSTVFGVEMTAALPERGLDGVATLGPAWVRRNGLLWKDVEVDRGPRLRLDPPQHRRARARDDRRLRARAAVDPGRARQPALGYHPPTPPTAARSTRPSTPASPPFWSPPSSATAARPLTCATGSSATSRTHLSAPTVCMVAGASRATRITAGAPTATCSKPCIPRSKPQTRRSSCCTARCCWTSRALRCARFFEGVLAAGAGHSFDILGFHSYCMFDSQNPDGHDSLFRSCATDWKVSFLRSLTRKYGIASKPLIRTEGALLCSTPHQACRRQQTDFIARMYARAAHDGLLGSLWYLYDSDSFRHSALVEPDDPDVARPAFVAMNQAAAMIGGTRYVGRLTGQSPGIEGYRFRRNNETITIVWSNTPQTASIPVSGSATVAGYGRDGHTIRLHHQRRHDRTASRTEPIIRCFTLIF